MAQKYYKFDYAEMSGSTIADLGTLYFTTTKTVSIEPLEAHTQEQLQKPAAQIIISNVTKLHKEEFETQRYSR